MSELRDMFEIILIVFLAVGLIVLMLDMPKVGGPLFLILWVYLIGRGR